MTQINIELPDEVAQRARQAGLLSNLAITALLEDAMRRQAGRALITIAKELHAADIPPMSDEEVVAEVKAARRARGAFAPPPQGNDAGRS